MATTTNYSWSTPDDTALVKDGAAAIRSLGTAIDSTVFTNAGAAINKTIIDAKGDLIVGTAADTAARLAVGNTNGLVLTVDSTETSGLKWVAPAGGGKLLQVVSATSSTSTTISSATPSDTTLTATITPTSASSKILVLLTQHFRKIRTSGIQGAGLYLLRGASTIWDGTDQLSWHNFAGVTEIQFDDIFTVSYVDSPATTSATTYKTQGDVWNAGSGGSVTFQDNSRVSTITLLEIGA
jgi:hypothetical protein